LKAVQSRSAAEPALHLLVSRMATRRRQADSQTAPAVEAEDAMLRQIVITKVALSAKLAVSCRTSLLLPGRHT
jgi:hypothetical protein